MATPSMSQHMQRSKKKHQQEAIRSQESEQGKKAKLKHKAQVIILKRNELQTLTQQSTIAAQQ